MCPSALQLERKLKAQIEVWECEQGRDFLVNGLKFLQYVEEQWELQRVEKEKEKMARVGLLVPKVFLLRLFLRLKAVFHFWSNKVKFHFQSTL